MSMKHLVNATTTIADALEVPKMQDPEHLLNRQKELKGWVGRCVDIGGGCALPLEGMEAGPHQ